ncbi:MAG: 16S rRNA (cytosine(1402)-N(4))-methyltransferase [Planctomycetaceae bacterium]|nr:16S rRNA (cytosine(1402)-N(4))-methyltransferase [Planctomycetaceae bacterium]
MSESPTIHIPVFPRETLEWLAPGPGQVIVDGTLGGAGHTRLIAELVGEKGHVLAIDRDPAAIERAEEELADLPVTPVHGSYDVLPEILREEGIEAVDGILLDLGLSSDQLADNDRGFSFNAEGPLDLRFDPTRGEPAWRLLNRLSAEHLANLIYEFGEERYSRRIGRRIVEQRRKAPIRTATELAELVRGCVPRDRKSKLDRATRTFQALRIAVNDELKTIERALSRFPDCLRPGGRAVVISFHSLEDRLVKTAFRQDPRYVILTKKPIRPNESEIQMNPRSRSARLRVAERATC